MLQEELDKAASFGSFFADIYCAAYVNGLVTMKDGLSQIFPGAYDAQIEHEIKRVYGSAFEGDEQLISAEIDAIESFLRASEDGSYKRDESTLIPSVEPLKEALDTCQQKADIYIEVVLAQQDREDYLNDYNFLQYLKSK